MTRTYVFIQEFILNWIAYTSHNQIYVYNYSQLFLKISNKATIQSIPLFIECQPSNSKSRPHNHRINGDQSSPDNKRIIYQFIDKSK